MRAGSLLISRFFSALIAATSMLPPSISDRANVVCTSSEDRPTAASTAESRIPPRPRAFLTLVFSGLLSVSGRTEIWFSRISAISLRSGSGQFTTSSSPLDRALGGESPGDRMMIAWATLRAVPDRPSGRSMLRSFRMVTAPATPSSHGPKSLRIQTLRSVSPLEMFALARSSMSLRISSGPSAAL